MKVDFKMDAVRESLDVVEAALQHLTKRYEERERGDPISDVDFQPFFDSLSEDAVFYIPVTTEPRAGEESRPPFNVVGTRHEGKSAVINAFATDQSDLTDWTVGAPLEYFANADGSRIVVLLRERYGRAGHDSVPWNDAAMVFDVEDGYITAYTHLGDMSGNFIISDYLSVVDA